MSSFIPLQQAIEMTMLYRQQKENILDPAFQNKNILVNSETFERAEFDTVLGDPNCVKLRIYYGMDDSLQVHAIIVGVDAKDQDILPDDTAGTTSVTDPGGRIIEEGMRCPPNCPPPSSLNNG